MDAYTLEELERLIDLDPEGFAAAGDDPNTEDILIDGKEESTCPT